MSLPPGIRNNNPGNIRRSSIKWFGLSPDQTDPNFCQFETAALGLRALLKNLINKQAIHGLHNVRDIVSSWAPASENNTEAYIAAVAGGMKVAADAPLDLHRAEVAISFAKEIVRHENGEPPGAPWFPHYWYSDSVYAEAFASAA